MAQCSPERTGRAGAADFASADQAIRGPEIMTDLGGPTKNASLRHQFSAVHPCRLGGLSSFFRTGLLGLCRPADEPAGPGVNLFAHDESQPEETAMLTPFVVSATASGGVLIFGMPLLFSSLSALRFPVRARVVHGTRPITLEPAQDQVTSAPPPARARGRSPVGAKRLHAAGGRRRQREAVQSPPRLGLQRERGNDAEMKRHCPSAERKPKKAM
jgi:hypothetical protein